MRKRSGGLIGALLLLALARAGVADTRTTLQRAVVQIERMPDHPYPLKIRDWKRVAREYDALVFDLDPAGQAPLVWLDTARRNFDAVGFGLYSSAWEARGGPGSRGGEFHEAINTIAAVLGATLVGIDKSHQYGQNWVRMCRNYFNRANGWNVFANFTTPQPTASGGQHAREFWYHLYPNILFFQLASLYPEEPGFTELLQLVAERMHRAVTVLRQAPAGFHYTWIDFATMTPHLANQCEQPDASAGFAWLQYAAYARFKNHKYLEGARLALQSLEAERRNPYYEVLLPFGAYTAARMNAEENTRFDIPKLVNWCFCGATPARGGDWGAVVGRWGGYEVSGLVGDSHRVFLMNTFDTASPLVPLVRYDPRFARAIGKWMLNAANAARLFYPYEIPDRYQSAPDLKSFTRNVIAYEALSPNRHGQPIFTDRDDWGAGTQERTAQFSLYGSSHVGIFASLVNRTTDQRILQLDCLATDFFRKAAYPTYLYYNPYPNIKDVRIDVGDKSRDLYDLVSHRYCIKGARGQTVLRLDCNTAAVIVLAPAGAKETRHGRKLLIDDVVVDYNLERAGDNF